MEEKNASLPVVHPEDDIPESMLDEMTNGKGENKDEVQPSCDLHQIIPQPFRAAQSRN